MVSGMQPRSQSSPPPMYSARIAQDDDGFGGWLRPGSPTPRLLSELSGATSTPPASPTKFSASPRGATQRMSIRVGNAVHTPNRLLASPAAIQPMPGGIPKTQRVVRYASADGMATTSWICTVKY